MSREGGCFAEVRPINCTPQSSPFIRKLDQFTPTELQWRRKRMKVSNDWEDTSNCVNAESKYKRDKSYPDVIDYSDPFSVPNLKEELNRSMYGSVTKDIEDLRARRFKMLNPLLAIYPSLSSRRLDFSPQSPTTHNPVNGTSREIIVVDDDCVANVPPAMEDLKLVCKFPSEETYGYGCRSFHSVGNGHQNDNNKLVVILDSDDEESAEQIGSTQAFCESQTPNNLDLHQGRGLIAHPGTTLHEFRGDQIANNMRMTSGSVPHTVPDANRRGSLHYHGVVLKKAIDESPLQSLADRDGRKSKDVVEEQKTLIAEKESKKDKGVYVGVQDDLGSNKSSSGRDFDDDLGDIWREMTLALECNKDAAGDIVEHSEDEEGEECDHSFFLKDDLGYVCRVCGVVKKSIETIFEFQWGKGSKTTRVYMSESRSKEREENDATPFSRVKGSHDLAVVDISVHPRHMKQMKTHQREGFNFLVRNLISDNPGGCILAHAPGSGKTFMIISFIQSFLTKYPNDARPMVVLPKGILGTWKREFIRWQVEDIPLYDLYSAKTESRKDQLDVLKQWVEHKGILFLGYKQLANIVSKSGNSLDAACQDILLTVPTILILDEGHTPRTRDTEVLQSLEKVQTPRKVVLSGTLFQNNVKEVFNILNLVRPKFLKSDTSKAIKRRVMSRGRIGRKQIKTGADEAFYEVVEDTLKSEENSKVKVAVIQDLREMTRDVLHYYKGDFLDELPGFVDLTVLLNLSPKQKHIEQKELQKLEKFKRISVGTAVYLHPLLKDLFENGTKADKPCKDLSENGTKADKPCNVNDDKLNDIIRRMDYREGVKAKFFLGILGLCESTGEKLLVFSQYKLPLKFLEMLVANSKGWSHGKETFMISGDTSAEDREWSMERFNNSSDAKVLFGSIKACGEGISLVGASRVLIMDVHLNPSVTRQAVGRAYRPGQEKKVYVYRLVAADTLEEEYHNSSFRKELISKMWFEWSEYCGDSVFEMETVNVEESDDVFWQSPVLREDLNIVKKR